MAWWLWWHCLEQCHSKQLVCVVLRKSLTLKVLHAVNLKEDSAHKTFDFSLPVILQSRSFADIFNVARREASVSRKVRNVFKTAVILRLYADLFYCLYNNDFLSPNIPTKMWWNYIKFLFRSHMFILHIYNYKISEMKKHFGTNPIVIWFSLTWYKLLSQHNKVFIKLNLLLSNRLWQYIGTILVCGAE